LNLSAEKLVAHRGYRALYPENSLLAHQKAIDAGALYLETDILFSADGEPLLYHDSLMQRLSGKNSAIHLETGSNLRKMPLHEPVRFGSQFVDEKIGSLKQFVDLIKRHPQVQCYVELKRTGLNFLGRQRALNIVLPLLAPIEKQATIISFDYEAIRLVRSMGFPRVGVVLLDWDDRKSSIVQGIKPECMFCNFERIPEDETLTQLPCPIIVYEVANADVARYWLNRGVDKIETFDVGGLLTAGAKP